jgi:hypothetical protein
LLRNTNYWLVEIDDPPSWIPSLWNYVSLGVIVNYLRILFGTGPSAMDMWPTYEELQGPILQTEKNDSNTRLEDLKKSWEATRCTVIFNGWTNGKGRTLLNFLVYCPRGTMFIKSVDALAHVKNMKLLCELMDGFIKEVGL